MSVNGDPPPVSPSMPPCRRPTPGRRDAMKDVTWACESGSHEHCPARDVTHRPCACWCHPERAFDEAAAA